jgi:hypothetical protein
MQKIMRTLVLWGMLGTGCILADQVVINNTPFPIQVVLNIAHFGFIQPRPVLATIHAHSTQSLSTGLGEVASVKVTFQNDSPIDLLNVHTDRWWITNLWGSNLLAKSQNPAADFLQFFKGLVTNMQGPFDVFIGSQQGFNSYLVKLMHCLCVSGYPAEVPDAINTGTAFITNQNMQFTYCEAVNGKWAPKSAVSAGIAASQQLVIMTSGGVTYQDIVNAPIPT